MSYSRNHIDVEVVLAWENFNPEHHLRYRSWDLLRSLYGRSSLPWVVGGDFNEILADEEKSGGGTRNQALMNAFRRVWQIVD